MKEYEMFPMIKNYFESLEYKVNAEVKDCDVTAVKDDELIIIEMKTSFNITVLYQALERKKVTPMVYIAVPKPKKNYRKSIQKMKNLLSKLHIGLLIIDVINGACVSFLEPDLDISQRQNNIKKAKIVKEISRREIDENKGGINKTKILTAHKELGIALCVVIEKEEVVTSKVLRDKYGFDKDVNTYLHRNFHRWYKKVAKATYELSTEGKMLLENPDYKNAVNHFRNKYKDIGTQE